MRTTFSPPSGRDFEVFRFVRFDEKSTRAAAHEFGLSQTRIVQIVHRIDDFLLEVSPVEKDDPRRHQRVHVAEQVAAERVNRLYGKALQAFEDSQGVLKTVRAQFGQASVSTSRDTQGDPRYLWIACRVAMQGGKLPVSRLESYVCWDEEEEAASETQDLKVVEVTDDAREVVDLAETSPPVEDCSAATPAEAITTNDNAVDEAASPSPNESSAVPAGDRILPKANATTTVQEAKRKPRDEAARRRNEFLAPLGTT